MLRALFLMYSLILCRSQQQEEAKYMTVFDSPIYVFSGEDYIDTSNIVVENYNETTAYMIGEFEMLKPVDNIILEIVLQKEASGKWEVLFSHDICDFCTEIGDEDSTYRKYLQYFGFPKSCPFEVGAYKIHNLAVETNDFGISDQHMGKYLAELNMYENVGGSCTNDRQLLFTMKIDMTIERA